MTTALDNVDRLREPKLERVEWQRGGLRRFVDVEPNATRGAMVGRDLYDPDGNIIADLGAYVGANVVAKDTKALNGVPADKIITPNGTLIVKQIQAEAIQAGSLTNNVALTSGRITATAGGRTLAMGVDMGSAADLLLWYGPTPANLDAALLKANGAFWIDETGAAYFGGGLATAKVTEQLAGRGANLLPDEYSMFESTVLPPLNDFGNVTRSRVAGNVFGLGALRITTIGDTNWHFTFLGATTSGASLNIPITRGKKYLLSAHVKGSATSFGLHMHDGTNYGTKIYEPDVALSGAAVKRLFCVIDTTAFLATATMAQVRLDVQGAINSYVDVEGIEVEEVIGTNYVPSSYTRGQAATLANTKTATFDQETQPLSPPAKPGDEWRQPSTNLLRILGTGGGWSIKADNSLAIQHVANLVKDGGFEAGGQGWVGSGMSANTIYVEATSNAAIIGSRGLIMNGPLAAGAYYDAASDMFPVSAGDTLIGECMAQNIGAPGDNASLVFFFYDLNGTYWSTVEINRLAKRNVIAGSNWGRVTGGVKVPANAMFARIGVAMLGMTTGYWGCDQFRAFKHTQGEARPANLIPNANFGGINGDLLPPWYIAVNANSMSTPNGLRNKKLGLSSGAPWTIDGNVGVLECYQDGTASGGAGTYLDIACGSGAGTLIPVTAGQRYEFHCKTANHRCKTFMYVFWLDGSQAGLSTSQTPDSAVDGNGGKIEGNYEQIGLFVTAPTNAAYARIFFRKHNTLSGANSFSWWIKPYFGVAGPNQVEFSNWSEGPVLAADEISTVNFGVVSNTDLYDGLLTRRLGLRVANSGHRIGDQRNLPQSLVTALGSVRTATALTAAAGGSVTVNAHTVRYGAASVAYNAVSNAITGLSTGVSYWVYCIDPGYAGGTQTWLASTDITAVMNGNDGVVVAGKVTIPSSGSSGGGGAGDCVLADEWVCELNRGWVRAGEIQAGDWLLVWNEDPEHPGEEWVQVESNEIAAEPCWEVAAGGALVAASANTPMTLRDGRTVPIWQLEGEEALVRLEGVATWQAVTGCRSLGYRLVAHIRVHQRCYFAGRDPAATIATHNPTYKP